jgi:tRNA1Val (adenine37-N6)-methyltransferase
MKVGTDAVLLGAWASVGQQTSLLDIGTGSGVIALMLAQRTAPTARIDAVEVEEEDAAQARENVRVSPWPEKVVVHHVPIQQFNPGKLYNVIVSNPPYFVNSQPPPEQRRVHARHTVLLDFDDLIAHVVRLLSPAGTFSTILPYTEGLDFINRAHGKLFCSRRWTFRARTEKPVERLLLEFSKQPVAMEEGSLVLYSESDKQEWSDHYKALTQAFYLKL